MPFITRCHTLGDPADRVAPDGEVFDTFGEALESLLADVEESTYPTTDHDSARFESSMPGGFVFDVQHVTGPRYRCTIVQADGCSDAEARDDVEALAYLQHDGGAVPCSRYGDAGACASVALVAARIAAEANGEPVTFRALDYMMGLAVNDSDDLADLLADHATDDDLDALGFDRLDAYRLAGRVGVWMDAARERGESAARALASWTVDGNTTPESARAVLALLDDGDPAAEDYLPRRPDLSGEFAGDETPHGLAVDVTDLDFGYTETDPSRTWKLELIDLLADEFESGVDDVFLDACEAELRRAAGLVFRCPACGADVVDTPSPAGYVACHNVDAHADGIRHLFESSAD